MAEAGARANSAGRGGQSGTEVDGGAGRDDRDDAADPDGKWPAGADSGDEKLFTFADTGGGGCACGGESDGGAGAGGSTLDALLAELSELLGWLALLAPVSSRAREW